MDSPNPHASEPQSGDFSDYSADPVAVPGIGNTEETPLEASREADVETTNVAEEKPLDVEVGDVEVVDVEVVDNGSLFDPPPASEAPAGLPGEPSRAANQDPSDDSEDSAEQINEYMASLMQRYGMDAAVGQTASISVPSTDSSTAAPDQSAPTQPTKPREPIVPPETWSSMAAMRELANLSTNRALEKHSTDQLTKQALVKLILSVVAMGVALVMAELSIPGKTVLFAAAVLTTACATLWGVQFLLTTRELLNNLSKRKASQPPEVTSEEESAEAGAALVRRLAKLQGDGTPGRSHDEPAQDF